MPELKVIPPKSHKCVAKIGQRCVKVVRSLSTAALLRWSQARAYMWHQAEAKLYKIDGKLGYSCAKGVQSLFHNYLSIHEGLRIRIFESRSKYKLSFCIKVV
jgi:hypothetical protein